jgi:hypothetical protein
MSEDRIRSGQVFDRRHLDVVVRDLNKSLDRLPYKNGPAVAAYRDAVKNLERLRPPLGNGHRLSPAQQAEVRKALEKVSEARVHAQRENLPADKIRNPGDDPGIDRSNGEVVRRAPGARTQMEKADDQRVYAKSGKLTYEKGATVDRVMAGQSVREGQYGSGVRRTQELLKAAGYDPGPVDGFYGPKTAEAAKRFLAEHHNQQGYIGAAELARLEHLARQRQATP